MGSVAVADLPRSASSRSSSAFAPPPHRSTCVRPTHGRRRAGTRTPLAVSGGALRNPDLHALCGRSAMLGALRLLLGKSSQGRWRCAGLPAAAGRHVLRRPCPCAAGLARRAALVVALGPGDQRRRRLDAATAGHAGRGRSKRRPARRRPRAVHQRCRLCQGRRRHSDACAARLRTELARTVPPPPRRCNQPGHHAFQARAGNQRSGGVRTHSAATGRCDAVAPGVHSSAQRRRTATGRLGLSLVGPAALRRRHRRLP